MRSFCSNQKAVLFRTSAVALVIGLSATPCAVSAQELGGDGADDVQEGQMLAAVPASENAPIIVTANKREQNLNDVGLTVAVLSGDDLRDRQVDSLSELANAIPSVSFSETAFNTPVFTVRGVGFYENSISAYPTVSLYLDEVPLSFPVTARHGIFDLERVEVLKGPQGTLFGQNSTGGAVNFIAARPTSSFEAGIDLSYGRFNEINGEAFVSGPLTDDILVRASGRVELADGWQYSTSRPNDRNGDIENYMGRVLFDIQPADALRIQLNFNGWIDRSETQVPQYTSFYPQIPGIVIPGITGVPFTPEEPRAADWSPGLPFGDSSFWQASARFDLDITENLTLTSLTAYSEYNHGQSSDQDGLPFNGTDVSNDVGGIESFFQEVRLSNGGNGAFRWILGANYEQSDTRQSITAIFGDSGAAVAFGAFFPTFGVNTYTDMEDLTNYAFYGNVELDIGDVTLKGGARYTNAQRSGDICNVDPTVAGVGQAVAFILLQGANGPYTPGTCYPANDLGYTLNGVAPGTQGRFAMDLDEDNVSWRLGLDWRATPDILIYGNVSRGYKAGSFPTLASAVFSQYLPVTQESVTAYEAGVKITALDGAAQLNFAGFYYDYQDKQIKAKVLDPVFGLLDVLQNIPESTITGFEIEASVFPTDGLRVAANFVYLDAEVDQFVGINGAGVAQNFAGTRIPFTPRFQIGINSDYTWDVSDSLEASIGGSMNFRSDTVAVIGGDTNPVGASPSRGTLFGIDDYTTVDLRASIGDPDDAWQVQLWGRNIFNEYYWNNVATTTDAVVRYAGRPASYGVTFSVRY